MPAPANERLAAARTTVDRVCQLLLSPTPDELDRCSGLLEAALSQLAACRSPASPALVLDPALSEEVLDQARLLKTSIGRASRLLESAAAFYTNWIRCLGALCAGYTPQGQPATLDRGAHQLARG